MSGYWATRGRRVNKAIFWILQLTGAVAFELSLDLRTEDGKALGGVQAEGTA